MVHFGYLHFILKGGVPLLLLLSSFPYVIRMAHALYRS